MCRLHYRLSRVLLNRCISRACSVSGCFGRSPPRCRSRARYWVGSGVGTGAGALLLDDVRRDLRQGRPAVIGANFEGCASPALTNISAREWTTDC